MEMNELTGRLYGLRDEKYRAFQTGLIPTVDPESVIGVRTPDLKKLAKEISALSWRWEFLGAVPHGTFEENQLHAFIVAGMRDFYECMEETEKFLPFIDNWATCDQFSPGVFRCHREELLPHAVSWLASERTYTVRFGIGMLMRHFLGDAFDPAYPEMVAAVRSGDYYVDMMAAWYFATALACEYDAILPYFEPGRLAPRVRAMAVRKAAESRRLSAEQKDRLRGL